MLKIGLTGGIASGKTTISNLFESLDIPIIDTDIISRKLLDIGQPGYKKVLEKLGDSILFEDLNINRQKLRKLVFADEGLKVWLESILHPLIYVSAQNLIEENSDASYVIIVVPLLFESNFTRLVDRVLVVDCSRDIQVQRLIVRDDIDKSLANSMLDQQWSNDARLELADDVIHNTVNEDLDLQVQELHRKYMLIVSKP